MNSNAVSDEPLISSARRNSGSSAYLGVDRYVKRSGAGFLLCPSDVSYYRCDQGCFASYMSLAKYGWWHRGHTNTTSRYYEYHQIQEVDKPGERILLAATEPATWQYGGCG